jgi:Na+-transporting methylmalonyl-CoA/oxaloacetate decarboxylase gamma subunit
MSGTLGQNLLAASELLVGFVLVMLTLVVLWGLTELLGRIVRRLEHAAAAPTLAPGTLAQADAADAVAAATAATTAAASSSDEEAAVIAAAVALMLDAPHRVVSVQTAPSAWGQQGRRAIQDSRRRR